MENLVISREYVEKNYIKKDKIEKIVIICQNSEKYYPTLPNGKSFHLTNDVWTVIEYIQELLEETEDENNNTFIMQKQEEQSTDFNKQ